MAPALFLAANSQTLGGTIGWMLLGAVTAGLRQWALVGLSRRKHE